MKSLNETLKGWRGIILAWLLTALTYAESAFNIASSLLAQNNPIITSGGWKAAAIVAIGTTLKNAITDVGKKK